MANNDFEKFQEIQQERFDALHSKELRDITKNYSHEEQTDICKVVSSDIMLEELKRREDALDNILASILKVINKAYSMSSVYANNLNLKQKEELISEIRRVAKLNE